MIYDQLSTGGVLVGGNGTDTMVLACPGGILTGAVDAARDLISASATFQTAVGAGDQPTAKKRVYVQSRSASGSVTYTIPFALITIPSGAIGTKIETGTFNSGVFEWMLFVDVPQTYADDPTNVFNWVGGIVEGIITDTWNIAGTGAMGRLFVVEHTLTTFQRSDLSEETDYMEMSFRLSFGVQ